MIKRNVCVLIPSLFLIFAIYATEQSQTSNMLVIPQETDLLSSFWNLYISSGETTSLERYAENFVKFLSVESYSYEKQAYLVSEVLFYTMFSRNYCKNFSSSMDEAVTAFLAFMQQQLISPLSMYAVRLYAFLAQKTNPFIPVNETQIFDFIKTDTQKIRISSVSKENIRLKLYEAYSVVEGMHNRFNTYRSKQENQTSFKLSKDAFYRVLHNPSYLYLILFDERYGALQDSFIRSCSSYLSLDEKELRFIINTHSYKDFAVFPDGFYALVSPGISAKEYNNYAALVYALSDVLHEVERNSMIFGYPIDVFFSSDEFEILLKIHDMPFYIHCIDETGLKFLCEALVFACASGQYVERVHKIVIGLPSKAVYNGS